MTDKTLLHPRDRFPALTVSLPGGRALRLPDDLAGHFGVVLFYRGSWCPYCNAQLSAFQRALDGLAEIDVTVVALSVDDEATTQELIAKHGLRFPVGYGADASAIAGTTGAFVNDDPLFLQSTGFVLDPGGRIVVSVYSSGAIGRLVPRDVIGLIRYLREQRLASREHPPGRGCRPDPSTAASPRATACPGLRIGWIATALPPPGRRSACHGSPRVTGAGDLTCHCPRLARTGVLPLPGPAYDQPAHPRSGFGRPTCPTPSTCSSQPPRPSLIPTGSR